MESISFENLSESKKKLENLLDIFGLAIPQGSWLERAYNLVNNLSKVYKDKELRGAMYEKENKFGDVHYALLDTFSIKRILPYISTQENSILKKKLRDILRISTTYNETELNNRARNTLWELNLFSRLKNAGMFATLADPNPDVLFHASKRKYFIQCKRIFSNKERALRQIIKDAVKQLQKDLEDKEENNFGIIALSLERPFAEIISIIQASSELDGKSNLAELLKIFIKDHGYLLQDPKIIKDHRIIGIMVYTAHPSIVGGKTFAEDSYIILTNTWPQSTEYQPGFEDFTPLKQPF